MQIGPMTLAWAQDLLLRYRVVTFDGFPDRAWLERLWQAYAHPPRAAIVGAVTRALLRLSRRCAGAR